MEESREISFTFIKPTTLYNLLQQGLEYSNLSDSNFLLMLDARSKSEYNESHIVTSKKAPQVEEDWAMLPYDSEVECRSHVVVYDSNTMQGKNKDGPAISCAEFLWKMGSRHPVKVLDGGYEVFSALYPFLRTQKMIFMPRELDALNTYPPEIIPGALYLGNYCHGNSLYIQKDLKIKAHVNCCVAPGLIMSEEGPDLLHIPVEDNNTADLLSHFQKAISFIDSHLGQGNAVLVYSDLGTSRSAAVVMAYLIKVKANSLQTAYEHVLECSWAVRPNRAFVSQLAQWEARVFGAPITDISDPAF